MSPVPPLPRRRSSARPNAPRAALMNSTIVPRTRLVQRLLALAALAAWHSAANAQLCVFLTGPAYLQDFNTLPTSGTSNNSGTLPQGWAFSEAGTGGTLTYTADNGG